MGNDWGAREIRAKRSISIHVPSWGTTLDGWKKSCADVKFQSTFPRGERHESSDTGPLPFKFQSTFPRGERHGRGSGCTLRSYFNPRSLVGNDAPVISTTKFFEISIHVPSWGTTEMYGAGNLTILFQSTFPRGERRDLADHFVAVMVISIHVPSWGTTILAMITNQAHQFQSTFPRGERRDLADHFVAVMVISIHVPSWGTTHAQKDLLQLHLISIHVPSWGTTANFHKYSLFFYAINIIFLLFIIPSLFSLVLFMLLF